MGLELLPSENQRIDGAVTPYVRYESKYNIVALCVMLIDMCVPWERKLLENCK